MAIRSPLESFYEQEEKRPVLDTFTAVEETIPKERGAISRFSTGVAKGILSTTLGAGQLGQRILQETAGRGVEAITGTPRQKLGAEIYQPETAQGLREDYLTPQSTAEQVGFVTEQIAEFLLPSGKVAALEKGIPLVGRTIIEAGIIGGQTAIQEGEFNDKVRTNAIIGAAFPLVGATLKPVGRIFQRTGEKISTTIIRPNFQDISDGYKPETLTKYKIGGNLNEMLSQVNNKINQLNSKLRNKLKERAVNIDVMKVYEKTKRDLVGRPTRLFGQFDDVQRNLLKIKGEILRMTGGGNTTDIVNANWMKRGAGNKGSWAFGNPDKEAPAIEKVYTTFYRNMREAIEKAGPKGIQDINRQIGELIPVNSAILRRIPVAMRNNIISLTDEIALVGAIFDPRALIAFGLNRVSKSGKFASLLIKAGKRFQKEATTGFGKRLFGQ